MAPRSAPMLMVLAMRTGRTMPSSSLLGRYARDEPALGRGRAGRGSRSPWGHADGPGRMAPRQGPRRAGQPHAGAAAGPSARIEPGREHLAISARQLVVEPRVRLLEPRRVSRLGSRGSGRHLPLSVVARLGFSRGHVADGLE